jgi:hypothetical protein
VKEKGGIQIFKGKTGVKRGKYSLKRVREGYILAYRGREKISSSKGRGDGFGLIIDL